MPSIYNIIIYYTEIMKDYVKVKTFTNGWFDWNLEKEHDNTNKQIPLKQALKDGLYILQLVGGRYIYMPVTEIKRNKPHPLLKFNGGELNLLDALGSLYLGPSYKDNAAWEEKAAAKWNAGAGERKAAEEKKAAEKKKQMDDDAAAARENKMRNSEQARREALENKTRQEEFGDLLSGYAAAAAPAPAAAAAAPALAPAAAAPAAPAAAAAPAAPAAAARDNGLAAARFAFGDVNQGFYDRMLDGGKRKKSRKPKRRNSRSKRRNSRSNRTLNKSKK
jgi:hypothetical protein